MNWKNDENYDGIDIVAYDNGDNGIYILPKKVEIPGAPTWLQKGDYISLPFTPEELREVLSTKLKDACHEATGSRFYGFGASSISWDSFRGRMNCCPRWCYSAKTDHPVYNRTQEQNNQAYIRVLWEAIGILEGENNIRAEVRKVRNQLNKCTDMCKIKMVYDILK